MGHYYALDGSAAHFQPNKSKAGETRTTTIRDAKKLDLAPSVTEILGVLDGKSLVDWKIRQSLGHAYRNADKIGSMTEDDFVSLMAGELDSQVGGYADIGSTIHKWIEDFCQGVTVPNEAAPYVDQFFELLEQIAPNIRIVSNERTFRVGRYGGSVDVIGIDSNGQRWIVDLKTKQSKPNKPMYLSEKYGPQVAAYASGIAAVDSLSAEEMPRTANVMLSATEPGRGEVRVWTRDEQKHHKAVFDACAHLWYLRNWPEKLRN